MSTILGIKFPMKFVNGRVVTSVDDQHIKESVLQIIGTNKYEYLMKPTFGSDLYRRVFDPINVRALIDGDIRDALRIWEKRIENISTSIDLSRAAVGEVGITVGFTIKGSNGNQTVSTVIGS